MTRGQKYYYTRKLTFEDKHFACLCGNKAVRIRHNSPVCQRCMDIEARLEFDFHRDSHGANDWVERQKIREQMSSVSPYDPSLFGQAIPT